MTDYTKEILLENLRKSFRHELVEMNLTRDMHNRPPLYDVRDVYVDEIESFFQSFIITSIQEAEQEMIKRVEKYNDEQISAAIWGDEYRDGFDHAFGGIWEILASLDKPVTKKD